MNTLTDLTPSMIMASGLKRISALTTRHGITSPEVWDALVRWGGILDDVNHPDTSCRNCGEGVTYIPVIESYVHTKREYEKGKSTSAKWCLAKAGSEAMPTLGPHMALNRVKMGSKTGRLANANPDLSRLPRRKLDSFTFISE